MIIAVFSTSSSKHETKTRRVEEGGPHTGSEVINKNIFCLLKIFILPPRGRKQRPLIRWRKLPGRPAGNKQNKEREETKAVNTNTGLVRKHSRKSSGKQDKGSQIKYNTHETGNYQNMGTSNTLMET